MAEAIEVVGSAHKGRGLGEIGPMLASYRRGTREQNHLRAEGLKHRPEEQIENRRNRYALDI
jgi:hypothetical protein